ncbi:MAG TPA: hypothetical protein VMH81_30980 [Bryobacteraceae bacterium]|nr:hypothetical protein [Bryobacteraceae bacterium]
MKRVRKREGRSKSILIADEFSRCKRWKRSSIPLVHAAVDLMLAAFAAVIAIAIFFPMSLIVIPVTLLVSRLKAAS